MRHSGRTRLVPRIRVLRGEEISLGPGKADLLDAIARTSRLTDAARELGMSYMRAWKLVGMMNESFREPLVEFSRGGRTRGGARLTKTGAKVLALYRQMERASRNASSPAWKKLRALLSS